MAFKTPISSGCMLLGFVPFVILYDVIDRGFTAIRKYRYNYFKIQPLTSQFFLGFLFVRLICFESRKRVAGHSLFPLLAPAISFQSFNFCTVLLQLERYLQKHPAKQALSQQTSRQQQDQ